jgi:hypothetical protein
MTPLDEDGLWFFKILYMTFTGRKIGAWSTVLVFIGTYALEFLLLSQGVYSLR